MDSKDTCAYPAIGANTGTTAGTLLATPGADNTLASTFTVLSASLPDQADGFVLCLTTVYGSGLTSCLVNLYIGASGQEQLLIAGIRTGRGSSTGGAQKQIYVPITIPAGSRVTARHQCNSAASSPSIYASFTPLGAGFSAEPAFGVSENWGANAAASKGTVLTASATPHTLGAKTELIAATGIDCRHICLQSHQSNAATYLLTLYVGASGSEVPIFGPFSCAGINDSSGAMDFSNTHGANVSFPLSVPAGSRISAAIQSSAASATADISVLAFG